MGYINKLVVCAVTCLGAAATAAPSLAVKGTSDSFRSIDLDKRCSALASYIQNFGNQHLEKRINVTGCAESNGAGGPQYSIEFKTTSRPISSYRIDVSINAGVKAKGRVRICDTSKPPTTCTKPNTGSALVFDKSNSEEMNGIPPRNALKILKSLHPNAKRLLSQVYRWISAKPWKISIFGVSYDEFVQKIIEDNAGFPFNTPQKVAALKFKLVPKTRDSPTEGKVLFTELPDSEFLKCFSCSDLKCLNSMVYKFENKHVNFRIENKIGAAAGWVIEGPDPLGRESKRWRYSCGASRYSLQSIIAP